MCAFVCELVCLDTASQKWSSATGPMQLQTGALLCCGQWTTGSLSFPLTALSHSSFLNLFYSFLTFCSQSFSIILTLCSFSFYSGAFSLHPSPMLQFPVDSDNECMVLLPCSHFLCELHAVMPSQKWFKSSGRARQRCCSCPLGRNKSRSLQSRL